MGTKITATAEKTGLTEIMVTIKETITVLVIDVSTSISDKSSQNHRGTTAKEEQARNRSSRKDAAFQVGMLTKHKSKNHSLRKYKIKKTRSNSQHGTQRARRHQNHTFSVLET